MAVGVIVLDRGFAFTKTLKPRLVLEFDEFLVVKARVVDRHVKVKAVRAAMASEAEISTTMRFGQ
jgi:hypothetical protein